MSSPASQHARRPFTFEDPELARRRRGAKQITLLAVALVLVTGTVSLAGAMLVRDRVAASRREQSYIASLRSDLRELVRVQEAHFTLHGRYGTLQDLGLDYMASQGVTVRVNAADTDGWHATAWHSRTAVYCMVTFGAGPAAISGQVEAEPVCS